MMTLDTGYLSEIAPLLPISGTRWGCSFDGQRMALVGYSLCVSDRHTETESGVWMKEETPVLFYASVFSDCTINRAVRMFDEMAAILGLSGLTLVFRGALGAREVFVRHVQRTGRHGIKLFNGTQGRWFKESEVLSAVADDKAEGVIRLAPEFENRPERVMLDEEIGLIDLDRRLSPLAEAFVFGLGYWSCVERRPKWQVGATNIPIY